MDGNKNGSFWPSYVDIMTTLFAITLILFAVSFSRFKVKEKQLKSLVEQYENIIDVYSTVGEIDDTKYFGYDSIYLKHLFTVDVEYQQKEYRIDKLKLDLDNKVAADNKRDSIIEAGTIIKNKIIELDRLQTKLEQKENDNNNIKFLVIIEGQASKVPFNMSDWQNNYTLSYLRAQFLNEFWKQNGIDLETISKRCQLLISGSGEGGVPRYIPPVTNPQTKEEWNIWNSWEGRNQRFLIQIVPVIGNIKFTKDEIDKLNVK